MNARLSFVHALSPLHAGVGQGVGIIDLPTAREKATGLPFLPGSSLKGALRARCTDKDECNKVFGPEPSNIDSNENQASAVQFSDQRLLLLPIRSLAGTFAWVHLPTYCVALCVIWRIQRRNRQLPFYPFKRVIASLPESVTTRKLTARLQLMQTRLKQSISKTSI